MKPLKCVTKNVYQKKKEELKAHFLSVYSFLPEILARC